MFAGMAVIGAVGLVRDVPLALRPDASLLGPVERMKSVKSRMDADCTLASLASNPLLRFSSSANGGRVVAPVESCVLAGIAEPLFTGDTVSWFVFVVTPSEGRGMADEVGPDAAGGMMEVAIGSAVPG